MRQLQLSFATNKILDLNCPLGDRINMAFASSIVTYGRAKGIVTATAMATEMGAIANMLEQQDDSETPLKKKLNSAGKILTFVGLIICAAIFSIGLLYGRLLLPQFLVAISLAISIIPEGLPATASIVMALCVKRMAKKNALIKKLPAVETLGNATVICTDKTGTLTLNKMTVTELAFAENFSTNKTTKIKDLTSDKISKELILAALLCNDASYNAKNNELIGDPTEGALLLLSKKAGLSVNQLRKMYPRIKEQAFDSERKLMTTVHLINKEKIAYTKGAIDELLAKSKYLLTPNGKRLLTEKDKQQILFLNEQMSQNALRVLGLARKDITKNELNCDLESELTFIGLIGMIDPPRPEVIQAVETCRSARIKTVMITGDHKTTALAIAKDLHIYHSGDLAISGQELDAMSDQELDLILKRATIFARVSPADKLRIIQSLKRCGEVTAMTGDGVNDAPALKAADIGVAMGINGIDVAKDAADMILLDDSSTTIVTAIKEGRRVYRNIQKIIQFLLVGNVAEISTLAIATIFNWNAPLLALHILWVNLATATLPALALGVDPASPNIMKHKPVKTGTVFEKDLVWRVISQGLFVALLTLTAYWIGVKDNTITGQTMAFSVLAVSQMIRSFNQHSNTDTLWKRNGNFNPWLCICFIISAFFMGLILFIPSLQRIFHLTSLIPAQWIITICLAVLSIVHVEISKLFKKNRQHKLPILLNFK